jgi:transposase
VYTNMEQWSEIRRRVLVLKESKRSVCREYNIHWDTLQKILQHSDPPGYRMSVPRKKRSLEAFVPVIEQILRDDRNAPRKQWHTAKRIFERLKAEHGYSGGYTVIKDAVRAWHNQHGEVFVPLLHAPGEAQVDFGQAEIEWKGVRWTAAMFAMTLPYSDAIFLSLFPRECTEAFLEGHRRAFEFFGGVPRRISYDNLKIAVAQHTGPHERELTPAFLRLISHYLFKPHFCRVRRANEKGHVENLIGFTRRNFLVPVPRTESFAALNATLEGECRADLGRTLRGKERSKSVLLDEERLHLQPLPMSAFEAARTATAKANSLALVRFDRNDYSVPSAYAHRELTLSADIEQLRVLCGTEEIASHERCWEKARTCFNPVHYLALLERKPGALDFARPLQEWALPECFNLLRRRLEAEFADSGTRRYIQVLRLLERVRMGDLSAAIERALELGVHDADGVRLILQQRNEQPVGLFCLEGRPQLKSVHVAEPDLKGYGALLSLREVSA